MANTIARCDLCNEAFSQRTSRQRYCSAPCRAAAQHGRSAPVTCADCGLPMVIGASSLPQGLAVHHGCSRPVAVRHTRQRQHALTCELCGDPFVSAVRAARYCGAYCRRSAYLGFSAPLTCRTCGARMMPGSSSATQGVAQCNPCRRAKHGRNRYKRGCRCEVCVKATRANLRQWRERYQEKYDVRPISGSRWISVEARLAIYERDGWACHLCGDPVARDVPSVTHPLAASLDHIIPQRLGGSHDPTNLKTAHRGCNSSRQDKPLEGFLF